MPSFGWSSLAAGLTSRSSAPVLRHEAAIVRTGFASGGAYSQLPHAQCSLTYRGEVVSIETLRTRLRQERQEFEPVSLTIVADARLNAKRLLEVMRAVRGPGISEISILTERLRDR